MRMEIERKWGGLAAPPFAGEPEGQSCEFFAFFFWIRVSRLHRIFFDFSFDFFFNREDLLPSQCSDTSVRSKRSSRIDHLR